MVSIENSRLGWVDSLRAIAMIAVVACHIPGAPQWMYFIPYTFHMPAFFMLSGALTKPNKFTTWGGYVAHQARHILLPYFLLAYICLPLWYLNYKILGNSKTPTLDLVFSPFVANTNILSLSNAALWFLPVLFLTGIIGWWILKFMSTHTERLCLLALVCLAGAALLRKYLDIEVIWNLDNLPIALFYYLLGFLLMSSAKQLSAWITGANWLVRIQVFFIGLGLVVLCLLAADSTGRMMDLHKNNLGEFPVSIIASIIGVCGYAIIFMCLPHLRFLEWYGRVTIGTLAFHFPIIKFIQNWSVSKTFLEENPIWVCLIVLAVTVPINWLLYRYLPWVAGARTTSSTRLLPTPPNRLS